MNEVAERRRAVDRRRGGRQEPARGEHRQRRAATVKPRTRGGVGPAPAAPIDARPPPGARRAAAGRPDAAAAAENADQRRAPTSANGISAPRPRRARIAAPASPAAAAMRAAAGDLLDPAPEVVAVEQGRLRGEECDERPQRARADQPRRRAPTAPARAAAPSRPCRAGSPRRRPGRSARARRRAAGTRRSGSPSPRLKARVAS